MESKTFNLAGQIFKFDSAGYQALLKYLKDIDAELDGDESRLEILEDIKARMAENLYPRKEQILTQADIIQLGQSMGDLKEAHNLGLDGKSVNSDNKRISIKYFIIGGIIILLLSFLACIAIIKIDSQTTSQSEALTEFENTTDEMLGWFYNTANGMFNWFYNTAEGMISWFYQKSDESEQKYNETTDNMFKNFYDTQEQMLNDFEKKQDEMQKEFEEDTDNMRIEFLKEIEE